MTYWIDLSTRWTLQDVQAYLNVVISFICAGSIFVIVRLYWQASAQRFCNGEQVQAKSLLSLNTIGEAIDVIYLLRWNLLTLRQNGNLLFQSILIILFVTASLFSGFIARGFTESGTAAQLHNVDGMLATRSSGSIIYATENINIVIAALNMAAVPFDQLMEFRPNNNSLPWQFESSDWNNSWRMNCSFADLTMINNVSATGDCVHEMWSEVPILQQLWTEMPSFDSNWSYAYDRTGYRSNRTAYRDIVLFMSDCRTGGYNQELLSDTDMAIRSIAVHLEGAPWNAGLSGNCTLASGPITKVSYTDMYCNLTRDLGRFRNSNESYFGAYPDAYSTTAIAQAYSGVYADPIRLNSSNNQDVILPSGKDLLRLYQAYMLVKDTEVRQPGIRSLHVEVRIAQISLVCVICCAVAATLILVGLISYTRFVIVHWAVLDSIPQSKLDWMIYATTTNRGQSRDRQFRQTFENLRFSKGDADAVPLRTVDHHGSLDQLTRDVSIHAPTNQSLVSISHEDLAWQAPPSPLLESIHTPAPRFPEMPSSPFHSSHNR